MRKLTGLCILTATLVAASANAQGIFIDKGDASAVDAMAGFGIIKDAWGVSALGGWTYRGVFDVGADFTYYNFSAGSVNKLKGYSFTPFATWYALRSEEDELPISVSFSRGVQRIFYSGNAPVANPEGWGLYAGGSVFRRMELGSKIVFVPEVFAAYDLKATRYNSGALDQSSGGGTFPSGDSGYRTEMKHNVRALLRPNLLVKAGNTRFLLMPYVGFQGAFAAGGNVGAMF